MHPEHPAVHGRGILWSGPRLKARLGREQRASEVVDVERAQILQRLADADRFTGMPSSPAIASAMPPFAVPSSFVRTIPSTSAASPNSFAWRRPFWPVVASMVEQHLVRGAGELLVDHAEDLRELLHQVVLRVEAAGGVDEDDVGVPLFRRAIASKATAPGSESGAPRTKPASARFAHVSSCSTAAARNVSAAPMTTDLPIS